MTGGPDAARRGWRDRLTDILLGAAFGLTTNMFSGASARRAIAASVTLAALLMASTRLRTLHPRAPLVRHGVRTLLVLSLSAVLAAAFGPRALTPYMLFAAVSLTAAVVLVPTDHAERLKTLAGAGIVGMGVTLAGFAATDMDHRQWLEGVAGVSLGISCAGFGIDYLAGRRWLLGVAVIAVGVALVDFGVESLLERYWVIGVAFVVAGVAVAGRTLAVLLRPKELRRFSGVGLGVAAIIFGVAVLGSGVAALSDRHWLRGAAAVGIGVAAVSAGVTALIGRQRLRGEVFIGMGVAFVSLGVELLVHPERLVVKGVAGVGGSVAMVLLGVASVGMGVAVLVDRGWLTGLGVVGLGIAGAGAGVAFLIARQWLAGVSTVGLGVAGVGFGVAIAASTAEATRLIRRLIALAHEPTEVHPLSAETPDLENPERRSGPHLATEPRRADAEQQVDQPGRSNSKPSHTS